MVTILAALSVLILQATDIWPPQPDFKEKVDYIKWFEDRVRGNCTASDNAFELYRKILPSMEDAGVEDPPETRFAGMHHDPGKRGHGLPGPWDPAEHPKWEASYQQHKLLLEEFSRAAARPYCLLPRTVMFGGEKQTKTLFDVRLAHHSYIKSCVKGLSEAAWRAEDGNVDSTGFVSACKTGLQAARQLEREPILISQLCASAIRMYVYRDLRCALHHGVLSATDREAVLNMLATVDQPPPAFAYALQGELASEYDFLQYAADPHFPAVGGEILGKTVPLIRGGLISAGRTAQALREFHRRSAEHAVLPFSTKRMQSLEDVGQACSKTNLVTSILTPSISRAYMLRTEAVAERRATRLVYALHVFKDKHGRWPEELEQMSALLPEMALDDPFTGKPFLYQVHGTAPLLYSAGLDGDDDEGKHDARWGEHWGDDGASFDGDYVFWPIPDVEHGD